METEPETLQHDVIIETEKVSMVKQMAWLIALVIAIISYFLSFYIFKYLLIYLETNFPKLFKPEYGTARPVHAITVAILVYVIAWYWLKNGEIMSLFSHRMTIYIIRRLLLMIPIFLGIALITFVTMNFVADPLKIAIQASPGHGSHENAAAREKYLREKWGLNDPPHVRFLRWLFEFSIGYLGESFVDRVSVNSIINQYMWETLKLQYISFFVALSIAIPMGILAAKYRGTGIDASVSIVALIGLSMPIFVTGIMLIYFFGGAGLKLFPSSGAHGMPPVDYGTYLASGDVTGMVKATLAYWADSFMHLVLPTVTLAFAGMAGYTRLVRAQMLEILRQDFILAARANGLPEKYITWTQAFRNALIPVVTFIGLFIGGALAGAPITESVFTWPGLGYYYVFRALPLFDYPVILSLNMVITVLILLSNLATDIAYVYLDPRIRI